MGSVVNVPSHGGPQSADYDAFTWANRPSALDNARRRINITDVGIPGYGSLWVSNGTRLYPDGGSVVIFDNPDVVTSDGTTTESVLQAVELKPGLLQDNDQLFIDILLNKSGTSDTSTNTLRIGSSPTALGTSIGILTGGLSGTNRTMRPKWALRRDNATTVRHRSIIGSSGVGVITNVIAATTVPDLDAGVNYLQLSTAMTSGTETTSLQSMLVTLVCGS